MKVIRYGDIFDTIYNEDGTAEDVLIRSNFTAPIILNSSRIETIEPYMGVNCRPFKNVSIITYETGRQFKVVGNYNELKERIDNNNRVRIKGYGG